MGSRFELEVTWHRAVVQNFYLVVEHGVRRKYENLILSKKQSSSVNPGVRVLVCACVCACTDMHMCDMRSCFFIYPIPSLHEHRDSSGPNTATDGFVTQLKPPGPSVAAHVL